MAQVNGKGTFFEKLYNEDRVFQQIFSFLWIVAQERNARTNQAAKGLASFAPFRVLREFFVLDFLFFMHLESVGSQQTVFVRISIMRWSIGWQNLIFRVKVEEKEKDVDEG